MVVVCTRELIAYVMNVFEMSMPEHGIVKDAATDER